MSDLEENLMSGFEKFPTMEELLEQFEEDSFEGFKEGELVEGEVISMNKNSIWLNLFDKTIGIIPQRELCESESIQIGDKVSACIIEMEDENGYTLLSVKRASKEKTWTDFEAKFKNSEVFEIEVADANKGGLLVEFNGVRGFLPVSQLSPKNYPRVSDGDKDEILSRLQKLIRQKMAVKIIGFDSATNKLIFSEKQASIDDKKGDSGKYKEGDKVAGAVSGVADFGAFIDCEDAEGLIHISEIAWEKVNKVDDYFKVGEKISALVIDIDKNGKLSLSTKRLKDDPWISDVKKYKEGSSITAKITKITPFGAFVKIDDKIDGLVHVSELAEEHVLDPATIVKLGDKKKFKILKIDPKNHRFDLSLKKLNESQETKEAEIEKLLGKVTTTKLAKAGYKTLPGLKKLDKEKLGEIPGIGGKTAEKILEIIK